MILPALVRGLVSSRVNCYREEGTDSVNGKYDWLHDCFLRYFGKLQMLEHGWELAATDSGRSRKMMWFYSGCICFDRPDGPRAGKFFTPRPKVKPGS